ncbi:MAG: flagellar motor protein MotB [Elusimicrobia bacterium]|nr:flagellar motor protein MotB [Elusimicrobiota bacterium]
MKRRARRRGLINAFAGSSGGGGGHKEETIWLICLSDLMTNLMLFFIIMYAMTRLPEADRAKMMKSISTAMSGEKVQPAEEVPQPGETQRVKEKEVADALKQLLDTKESEVVLSEKLIRIRLSSPVSFASGSDELTRKGQKDLSPIRGMLKDLSNAVIVEGFTDNVPIVSGKFKTNWELSAARASSVRRYLADPAEGIPESRIVIAAYGEYKPVAPNTTPEGRRANRRIEITVVRR